MTVVGTRRQPPGPKGKGLLGVVPLIRRNPTRFFVDVAREYGDIAHWKMGKNRIFFINHPDAIKHVLGDNHKNYRKSRLYEPLRPLLGDGLPMQEGRNWTARREVTEQAFDARHIEAFVPTMQTHIDAMVARWARQLDEPIDLTYEMAAITLRVAAAALLSTEVESDIPTIVKSMATLLHIMERRVYSALPLPYSLPLPSNLRFKRAMVALDGVIARCLDKHSANGTNDLLGRMLEAKDGEGNQLDRRQLHGETRSTLIAGHETTASALAWTFYMLAKNPPIERRVRAEIDEVLRGAAPTFSDLHKMRYTRMVLFETLRLYPSGWMFSRTPIEDDEILGYHIPKESVVSICPYALHRRADIWPNPEGFDPDRFEAALARNRSPYAYLGFGGGPRNCIGSGFALVEAALILASVIQRFRFELIPGQQLRPVPMITLRINGSMWMRMTAA